MPAVVIFRQADVPAVIPLVTKSSGRNLATVVHAPDFFMGEYAGHGGGEDVDFGAALEGGVLDCELAGGLASQIQLHFHGPAVWQESVERVFTFWRRGQRNALVIKFVKDYLLIEFAGG